MAHVVSARRIGNRREHKPIGWGVESLRRCVVAGLEMERRLYELSMATEDRVEGMRAFIEKRKPDFKGK